MQYRCEITVHVKRLFKKEHNMLKKKKRVLVHKPPYNKYVLIQQKKNANVSTLNKPIHYLYTIVKS